MHILNYFFSELELFSIKKKSFYASNYVQVIYNV